MALRNRELLARNDDDDRTFVGPKVAFLTAYQFSYTLCILLRSDSLWPSATGLLRVRVHCVRRSSCADDL